MPMDPTALRRLPELTVEFFNRCADDPELSERMSFADTTVQIHFVDPDHEASCTVYLDRTPISAELGTVGTAEIELFAPSGVFLDLFLAKEKLPMAIVAGDVTYKGPVRKFLRVTPMLTSFSFDMFTEAVAKQNGGSPVQAVPTPGAPLADEWSAPGDHPA